MAAVLDYEKIPEEQRGTFLRERGLHEATLGRWKAEIIEGMKLKLFAPGKKDPQQKRIAAWNGSCDGRSRRWLKRRRCWCSKKSGRDLGGGKGREIALEDRLKCHECSRRR